MLPHICVFFPLPLSLALISSDFLFLHTNDAALYENWMELEPVTTILKAHIWTLYTKQQYKVMLDLKQKHTTFQLSVETNRLRHNTGTPHWVNARLLSLVLARFLSLYLFAFFASSIGAAFFLLERRVFSFPVLLPLMGIATGEYNVSFCFGWPMAEVVSACRNSTVLFFFLEKWSPVANRIVAWKQVFSEWWVKAKKLSNAG